MKGEKIVDLVIVKLEEKSAFLTPQNAQGPILLSGDNIDELKPVYSYINAHLAEAANEVLLSAPLNRLTPVAINDSDMSPSEQRQDGTGRILLPPCFLRLYCLQMIGWSRPVHKAITKSDHLYTVQYNSFTKGTPQKPVVIYSGTRGYYDDYILPDGTDMFSTLPVHYVNKTYNDMEMMAEDGIFIYKDKIVIFNNKNRTVIQSDNIPYLEYYSVQGGSHNIQELSYIPQFRMTLDYNRDIAEAIALNCAKKVMEVFGNAEGITLLEKELNSVLTNMRL